MIFVPGTKVGDRVTIETERTRGIAIDAFAEKNRTEEITYER